VIYKCKQTNAGLKVRLNKQLKSREKGHGEQMTQDIEGHQTSSVNFDPLDPSKEGWLRPSVPLGLGVPVGGLCGRLKFDPLGVLMPPNGGTSSGWWMTGVLAGLGINFSLAPALPGAGPDEPGGKPGPP
jgi:hypothetical protein